MENPFKFGTLVDNEYFTDRVTEQQHVSSMLDSPNHIVLISPRRFGKSSLVKRVVRQSGRPFISLNMQQVTCVEDLAAMILKGVFKLHPWEKLKHLLANFRVIPTISTTPLGDSVEIGFQPTANLSALLEDALSLVERVSEPSNRMIVVFDEFQEIMEVEKGIDRKLRAIMQEQQNVNYIFLGSEENTIGFGTAASDASAQLMQLRKTEPVGILNDHQGGIGYVHAYLDDCGGHQNVPFALGKGSDLPPLPGQQNHPLVKFANRHGR